MTKMQVDQNFMFRSVSLVSWGPPMPSYLPFIRQSRWPPTSNPTNGFKTGFLNTGSRFGREEESWKEQKRNELHAPEEDLSVTRNER